MASAPMLHATSGRKRLSAVEACRVLAGEIWRREKKLENFRSGGLNSEKAVRQRLQSMAMEMQRLPSLDEKVALHLYSIDWLEADPLTILERTEGLVDRQCRDGYASVDAMLRERDRATELAIRLLVLQGLAGRVGRWAVRAGEIPDARIARAHYRELRTPEWSQYRKLTEEATVAFEWADYPTAAARVFDADRLVRTPATLMMAAVALSREADFAGALWTIRVCLLEPEESFESEAALKKARTLAARLREIVDGRQEVPVEAERALLESSSEAVAVQPIDVLDERKDVLETESAQLLQRDAPAPAKATDQRAKGAASGSGSELSARAEPDRWGERYLSDEEAAAAVTEQREERVLITPKPVLIDRLPPRPPKKSAAPTRKAVVTVYEKLGPEDRIPTFAQPVEPDRVRTITRSVEQERIPTGVSTPEHRRLIERERAMHEASFFEDTLHPPQPRTELETARSAQSVLESDSVMRLVSETYDIAFPAEEEVTYVPAGPSEDVSVDDFQDATEIPPDPQLRRLRELALQRDPKKIEAACRAISAAADLDLRELSLPEAVAPPEVRPPTATTRRRVIPANLADDPSTDMLSAMTLPMGQHTRETALAALDREESTFQHEAATAQIPAARPPSQPTGKIVLRRTYEVTQIVRARHLNGSELEPATEQLGSRSPLDRDP